MQTTRSRDRIGGSTRRLAIVGGGPIGIEAALYGLACGYSVKLYERASIAANVSSWGHVRMFTPWRMTTTVLGRRLLDEHGLDPPEPGAFPTGEEYIHGYLFPLARSPLLAGRISADTRVVSISRESQRKVSNIGRPEDRATTPFRLLLHDGAQGRIEHADVVIDASGTYGNPCGFGAGGMDPLNAPSFSADIDRVLLDVSGIARDRYAGKHVLLVGSGFSAATQVVALAELAKTAEGTRCTWITAADTAEPVAPIDDDPLQARRELTEQANALAADDMSIITHIRSALIGALARHPSDRLNVDLVHGDGSHSTVVEVDVIMALVGYRPDLALDSELQVHRCYATEGIMKLAAKLLGEGSTDCLAQGSHGPESLKYPEPDFYCVGTKSYGRNSHFLLTTGHEQVRDVFKLITGDDALDLYEEM